MKRKNPVRDLVLGALFLALALVLPFLTGQIPEIGGMLCPMIAGRVVWGIARLILAGIGGEAGSFTFAAFISGAVTTAVPGIIVQLILIPVIVAALRKAKLVDTNGI